MAGDRPFFHSSEDDATAGRHDGRARAARQRHRRPPPMVRKGPLLVALALLTVIPVSVMVSVTDRSLARDVYHHDDRREGGPWVPKSDDVVAVRRRRRQTQEIVVPSTGSETSSSSREGREEVRVAVSLPDDQWLVLRTPDQFGPVQTHLLPGDAPQTAAERAVISLTGLDATKGVWTVLGTFDDVSLLLFQTAQDPLPPIENATVLTTEQLREAVGKMTDLKAAATFSMALLRQQQQQQTKMSQQSRR